MKAQVLTNKPVHFVLLTDVNYKQQKLSRPVNIQGFRETGPRAARDKRKRDPGNEIINYPIQY